MHFIIALILSAITWFMVACIYIRYVAYSHFSLSTKIISFVLLLIMGSGPILGSNPFLHFYGKFTFVIQQFFFGCFIFIFLLFSFTIIRDLVWLILHFLTNKIPTPLSNLCLINALTLIFVFLVTIWSFYEGYKIPNFKELNISSNKVNTPYKIAVLTDLHINRTTPISKIKKIVERVNKLHPDIILLVGDTLDDEKVKILKTSQILQNLKATKGVYVITGNHEFYIGYNWTTELFSQLGMFLLDNKGIKISQDLFLGGVSDVGTLKRLGNNVDINFPFKNAQDEYRILLSHTPTYHQDPSFDLEISGHTHGGQIWPFHFLSWWGNHHYLAGLYKMGKSHIYVSRGSGQWGPQLRFLSPSEITLINLHPIENH